MIDINDIKRCKKRFDDLLQQTIIKYADVVDLNDDIALYDTLMSHLVGGKLEFHSAYLDKLADADKKSILETARQSISLCFKQGNSMNWLYSVGDIPIEDSEYICIKLLDDYDFLIKLIYLNPSILNLLKFFEDSNAFDGEAIIGRIRSLCKYDFIAEEILSNMCDDNGEFSCFSNSQKATMISFANPILFYYDKGDVIFPSGYQIAKRVYKANYHKDCKSESELLNSIKNIDSFEEIIIELYKDN